MFEGSVEAIFIGPRAGEPMESRSDAHAVAGRGLEGDRYFAGEGTFYKGKGHDPRREITLIESEAVEAAERAYEVEIDAGETRRNLVTRDVPLNHLVDKEFTVGEVRLRGIKLCEPCSHLEKLTAKGVRKPLIHRGGLRAQILESGTIAVGDRVASASPPTE
jgi:MOSC domain-containing protein YiiM